MDEIYVAIGNLQLKEKNKTDEEPNIGVLDFLVQPEMLDNTYKGLLSLCLEECTEREFNDGQVAVYELMSDAVNNNDPALKFIVTTYNRANRESASFSLEDHVRDTIGSSMYQKDVRDNEQIQQYKAFELYLLTQPKGGFE